MPASRRGAVRTFVVYDKAYHADFEGRLPDVGAVVALGEGPEIVTNANDIDVAAVDLAQPVRIVVAERGAKRIYQAPAQPGGNGRR